MSIPFLHHFFCLLLETRMMAPKRRKEGEEGYKTQTNTDRHTQNGYCTYHRFHEEKDHHRYLYGYVTNRSFDAQRSGRTSCGAWRENMMQCF